MGDTMDYAVNGMLHGVLESKRIIAIKKKQTVHFYYMSKGMFRNFMMYFTPGIYVYITVKEKKRIHKGFLVQNVTSIEKVLKPDKNKPIIYYDISIIKSGIKRIVNEERNRLFIDFEMSMPPYTNYESFISEIIQVGYVLIDEKGNVIEEYKSYIKPTLFPVLSKRALKFLHITQSDVDGGIPYITFYQKFNLMIRKYNPIVYVWGRNDQLELSKMNRIYKLRNSTRRIRFINLLNLHKIYFGLKNDIGLFNAFNLYSDMNLNSQIHDAMEDALVTKKVFSYFKMVCNNQLKVTIDKK